MRASAQIRCSLVIERAEDCCARLAGQVGLDFRAFLCNALNHDSPAQELFDRSLVFALRSVAFACR